MRSHVLLLAIQARFCDYKYKERPPCSHNHNFFRKQASEQTTTHLSKRPRRKLYFRNVYVLALFYCVIVYVLALFYVYTMESCAPLLAEPNHRNCSSLAAAGDSCTSTNSWPGWKGCLATNQVVRCNRCSDPTRSCWCTHPMKRELHHHSRGSNWSTTTIQSQ